MMPERRLEVRTVKLILSFPVLLASAKSEIGLDQSDSMCDKTQGPLQILDNALDKCNKHPVITDMTASRVRLPRGDLRILMIQHPSVLLAKGCSSRLRVISIILCWFGGYSKY